MFSRRQVFLALGALALTAPTLARAQEIAPVSTPAVVLQQGISVNGHAEIKVTADVAYATLTVTTQARDAATASQENATRATALRAALRQAGVADPDIQTQSYMVQPQYDYRPSPPVLTGYQAQNTIQVTLHDVSRAGLIVDQATRGGGAEVGGISYDLADRRATEARALAQAVVNARAKAEAMAAAADIGLGRLLNLSEASAPVVRPLFAARAVAAEAPAPTTPLSAQQISVTADVTALYAFGPAR